MLLLAIRFLVELLGAGILAYAGASIPGEPVARVILAVGMPAALVVAWALLVAPNGRSPLPLPARSLLGTALLVLAGVALALAGHPGWGAAYAAIVVVDQVLLLALGAGSSMARLAAGEAR